ncbi:hypothetical protein EVG20_g3796 [Dentipellis fragilis]|uniref:Uncharacterized protein n=1 Tax=Dentipellis fragilis TaxID=205917 RepID=A0A4Y9YZN5_9AGAM|nr:hypothetical protein EVG20_g3796 [Dentipellis fragilis]
MVHTIHSTHDITLTPSLAYHHRYPRHPYKQISSKASKYHKMSETKIPLQTNLGTEPTIPTATASDEAPIPSSSAYSPMADSGGSKTKIVLACVFAAAAIALVTALIVWRYVPFPPQPHPASAVLSRITRPNTARPSYRYLRRQARPLRTFFRTSSYTRHRTHSYTSYPCSEGASASPSVRGKPISAPEPGSLVWSLPLPMPAQAHVKGVGEEKEELPGYVYEGAREAQALRSQAGLERPPGYVESTTVAVGNKGDAVLAVSVSRLD